MEISGKCHNTIYRELRSESLNFNIRPKRNNNNDILTNDFRTAGIHLHKRFIHVHDKNERRSAIHSVQRRRGIAKHSDR